MVHKHYFGFTGARSKTSRGKRSPPMLHLSVTLAPIQTPMERIFEKVMLRKMTEQEKEVLELKTPFQRRRKHSGDRTKLSLKTGSRLVKKIAAKLTSI